MNTFHRCEACGQIKKEIVMEQVPNSLTNQLMWVCELGECPGNCRQSPYDSYGYTWKCALREGKGSAPCEHVNFGVCVG